MFCCPPSLVHTFVFLGNLPGSSHLISFENQVNARGGGFDGGGLQGTAAILLLTIILKSNQKQDLSSPLPLQPTLLPLSLAGALQEIVTG